MRNEFHLEISPWNKIPQKTYMSGKMKQNFRGDTADRLFQLFLTGITIRMMK